LTDIATSGASPASTDNAARFEALVVRLGHPFREPSLLVTALRHRSWCVEHPGHEANERLEFLGDAVLGLVVAAELFQRHPELAEGRLTEARKAVVSAAALAPVARDLGLGEALELGRGEEMTGGRQKASLLENALEAVVGAVYLDDGLDAARTFVLRHLSSAIAQAATQPGVDFKSRLQELVARRSLDPPRYEVSAEGPDHAKNFSAVVWVAGATAGQGQGSSKKQAEQEAAREALAAFTLELTEEEEAATSHERSSTTGPTDV
jgi:ribonuclease-3